MDTHRLSLSLHRGKGTLMISVCKLYLVFTDDNNFFFAKTGSTWFILLDECLKYFDVCWMENKYNWNPPMKSLFLYENYKILQCWVLALSLTHSSEPKHLFASIWQHGLPQSHLNSFLQGERRRSIPLFFRKLFRFSLGAKLLAEVPAALAPTQPAFMVLVTTSLLKNIPSLCINIVCFLFQAVSVNQPRFKIQMWYSFS